MGIRVDRELADWLWEQRSWSKWAESVALYFEAHGFMTDKQHEAAMRVREKVEEQENA